jgi:glycogen operon protein
MTRTDWQAAHARSLVVFLNGNAISEPGARGEPVTDDSFLLMFNAAPTPQEFLVPVNHGKEWQLVVDTERAEGVAPGTGERVQAGDRLLLADRSMVVLQRPAD